MSRNYLDYTGLQIYHSHMKDYIADHAVEGSQSDWDETDSTRQDYIKNKPTLGTVAEKDIATAIDTSDNIPTSNQVKTFVEGKGYITDADYIHTDNNYTTTDKTKLTNIEDNAQVNIIETVKVNGEIITPSSKAVDIAVPTKTSDIINDSNYVVDSDYVHTDNNYTTADKDKLSGIVAGAEVNQNTFSNVAVGDTTITANAKTDILNIEVGTNITITPDTDNKKLTIAAKDTTYSAGNGTTISGTDNTINVTYGTTANTACQGNDSRLSDARPSSDVVQTYSATSTVPISGKGVAAALATLPEPMVFKGSVGTGGTVTTLPNAASTNKGHTYKVITAGTYASQAAKVGDTFISDGSTWTLIPSGDEPEGTVTSVGITAGDGISVSGSPVTSSGNITVTNSGVRSIATGSTNGTISVNTNGTAKDVAVKGLGSNAYTSTAYAPLASPTFTGTPKAPTAAAGTNTTQLATTAFVTTAVANKNTRNYYGTCSTAADTAAKVVTVSDTTFSLEVGVIVGITFSISNTASNVTLNVNNTGAKEIWYNNAKYTAATNWVTGVANITIFYMYDGTYWRWISHSADNNTTYSNMSASELDTGTATNSRVIQASVLGAKFNTKVNKAGDTMTGDLTITKSGATTDDALSRINFSPKDTTTGVTESGWIGAYGAHSTSNYGVNMVIHAGGNLFVGSGESPNSHYKESYVGNTGENTYITADTGVMVQGCGNTIANRKGFYLNNSHQIIPVVKDASTNNVGSIGTSAYKWANLYVTKINGVEVGTSPKFTDTNTTYTASTASIGSATAGTAIAADDITAWSAGTAASASVSKGVMTITNGTAPSLTYTARSIPNISVASKTVVTGITAS